MTQPDKRQRLADIDRFMAALTQETSDEGPLMLTETGDVIAGPPIMDHGRHPRAHDGDAVRFETGFPEEFLDLLYRGFLRARGLVEGSGDLPPDTLMTFIRLCTKLERAIMETQTTVEEIEASGMTPPQYAGQSSAHEARLDEAITMQILLEMILSGEMAVDLTPEGKVVYCNVPARRRQRRGAASRRP